MHICFVFKVIKIETLTSWSYSFFFFFGGGVAVKVVNPSRVG